MAAVLVLRRGGLGDTLLLLPVLAALRRAHPDCQLHFAGVGEFGDVLQHYGAVDRVVSSETLALWSLGRDGVVAERVRAQLAGYAQVVADDAAVGGVAGVRAVVFEPRPARDDVPLALQIGSQLGLAVRMADAVLVPPRERVDTAVVALAPGSGAASKCWPRDRWLELAGALAAAGRSPCVVVGPAELERDDPRRWPWPVGTQFLADLPVAAVAQRLAGAAAFVGNDSGTSHLAACLRVPTVVVFGGGRPRVYAPHGGHVRLLLDPTRPPAVALRDVRRALAELLG